MNDEPQPGDVIESSQPTDAIEEIDFAKYRTPELVKTITELLSVGEKAGQVAICSVLVSLALVILFLILAFKSTPLLIVVVLVGYLLPAGWTAGLFLGLAEVVRRSMDGLLSIVDLLLEETANIANDVRNLRGGTQRLPEIGVLVDKVYHHVVYPVIREVVLGSLGIIGRPILWIYRLSLDRMVKIVIRRFIPDSPADLAEAKGELAVTRQAVEVASGIEASEDKITQRLNWTRQKVKTIGGWFKLMIAGPCYLLFAVVLLLAIIPVLITCYFASGDKQVPEVTAWFCDWVVRAC